jgi:hypothetical protein
VSAIADESSFFYLFFDFLISSFIFDATAHVDRRDEFDANELSDSSLIKSIFTFLAGAHLYKFLISDVFPYLTLDKTSFVPKGN